MRPLGMQVFTSIYLEQEPMTTRSRLPLDIYSEALRTLELEPGPSTAEKATLMQFLRARIADYDTAQRIVRSTSSSRIRPS